VYFGGLFLACASLWYRSLHHSICSSATSPLDQVSASTTLSFLLNQVCIDLLDSSRARFFFQENLTLISE